MSIQRIQHRRLETGYDYTSLYVYEAETGDLIRAIDEADALTIPVEGDRLSFLEATIEGDLSTADATSVNTTSANSNSSNSDLNSNSSSHTSSRSTTETGAPVTYVVDRREITYLAVDYDLEAFGERQGVISEVSVWVREAAETS